MKALKREKTCCSRLKEFLYEFYTQVLMQNHFSFTLWLLCYLLSFLQILDFTFHSFGSTMSKESFVSSLIVSILEYSSVMQILTLFSSALSFPTQR